MPVISVHGRLAWAVEQNHVSKNDSRTVAAAAATVLTFK